MKQSECDVNMTGKILDLEQYKSEKIDEAVFMALQHSTEFMTDIEIFGNATNYLQHRYPSVLRSINKLKLLQQFGSTLQHMEDTWHVRRHEGLYMYIG